MCRCVFYHFCIPLNSTHYQGANLYEKSRRTTMRITTTTSELHSTGQPGSPQPAGMIHFAFEHQHQLKQIYSPRSRDSHLHKQIMLRYAENMLKKRIWKATPVMPPTPCWSTLNTVHLVELPTPAAIATQKVWS